MLLKLAARLSAVPLGWSLLDLLVTPEGPQLLVGLDGYPAEVERRWRALEDIAGEIAGAETDSAPALDLVRVTGEEARDQRRALADGVRLRASPLALRVVTTHERTARIAAQILTLCAGEADTHLRHHIRCHPGIGLLRVAFASGCREVRLRRLLLRIAGAVREIGGYRALDRAPAHPFWGWDAWGTSPLLRERMRQIRAVFDTRGCLAPWDQVDSAGGV
jgi:hypothetical protein